MSKINPLDWKDDDVRKEIAAFEFVNNYPKDRTPICSELNGKFFRLMIQTCLNLRRPFIGIVEVLSYLS